MAVAHKSAIIIGLLYIPVGLYKTTRDTSIAFNHYASILIRKSNIKSTVHPVIKK